MRTMVKENKVNWGVARLQTRQHLDEIVKLKNKGWSLNKIATKLLKEGRISCGNSTFRRHASELLKEQHIKNNPSLPVETRETEVVKKSLYNNPSPSQAFSADISKKKDKESSETIIVGEGKSHTKRLSPAVSSEKAAAMLKKG